MVKVIKRRKKRGRRVGVNRKKRVRETREKRIRQKRKKKKDCQNEADGYGEREV